MNSTLTTICPECDTSLKANETLLGQRVRCPGCSHVFMVSSVSFSTDAELWSNSSSHSMPEIQPDADPGITGVSAPRRNPSSPGAADLETLKTRTVGRFEIRELLGQGAFGRVYRARDSVLDREVALKVPRFGPDETRLIKRFQAEARAAARLRHPNIVSVYDCGQADGRYFIASEYIQGETLADRLKTGAIPLRSAVGWIALLAEALGYAHGEGVVHRDIKPGNVMLDHNDRPQLMDFGLATRVDAETSLSTEGSVIGTPAYMSPEQARGELQHVGPHSDQYSLGVMLFELLTGRRPFEGSAHVVIAAVASQAMPHPTDINKELPLELEAICLKATERDSEQRYADASDLAADLRRWLEGHPVSVRPIGALGRLTRWCQRNRTFATMIFVSAASLLIGSIVSIAFAVEASFQARQADTERQRADEKASEAEKSAQLAEQKAAEAEANAQLAERNEAETLAKADEARRQFLAAMSSSQKADKAARLVEQLQNEMKELQWSNPATRTTSETPARPLSNQVPIGRVQLLQSLAASGELIRMAELIEKIRAESPPESNHEFETNYWAQRVRYWLSRQANGVRDAAGQPAPGMDLQLKPPAAFSNRRARIFDLFVNSDGRLVTAGFNDGAVVSWDTRKTPPTVSVRMAHHEAAASICLDRRRNQAAIRTTDAGLSLWSFPEPTIGLSADGTEIFNIPATQSPTVADWNPLMFLTDTLLLSVRPNRWIEIRDIRQGQLLGELRGHRGGIVCGALSPDERWLITADSERRIHFWDLERRKIAHMVRQADFEVSSLSISDWFIVCGCRDGTVRLIEWFDRPSIDSVQTHTLVIGDEKLIAAGHTGPVTTILMAPGGRRIISGGIDGTVRFRDVQTGQQTLLLTDGPDPVSSLAINADGTRLVAVLANQTVRVWIAEGLFD